MPSSKGTEQNLTYHPWFVFPPILISSFLISYGHPGLQADLWLFLFGIALPTGFGIALSISSTPGHEAGNPFWETEFLSPVPGWIIAILGLLFVLSRFYRLDSIPFWPLMDEGQCGFFSMNLCEKWDGRLLFGNTQIEPLFLWLLALFFKVLGFSPYVLRLFSALFSLATVATGYWTARQFFPRSFSLLLTVILAFHFWTWTLSRLCAEVDVALLWQFLTLGLLGIYLKSAPQKQWKPEVLLGLLLGVGFYIYPTCLAMVPAVGLVLFFRKGPDSAKKAKTLLRTSAAISVVAWPMVMARLSGTGSAYLSALLGPNMAPRYLASLFFDGFGSVPYGPIWGGLFNALLGSCLWIGLIECVRLRKKPFVQWLGLAGFLFFLPGALTAQVESKRIIMMFPLLIVAVGFGIQALVCAWATDKKRRLAAAGIILLSSSLLDAYHYFGPYQDWKTFASNPNHWTSIEVKRAYDLMDDAFKSGKRFLVLDHFGDNFKDRTFEVAAASWDPSRHPQWPASNVQEAALITNVNYKPFLEKRFPDSQWVWLCPDLPDDDGGLMLGWIPITDSTRPTLEAWVKADQAFEVTTDALSYLLPYQSSKELVDQLIAQKAEFMDDPFLRSIWGERVAYFISGGTDQDPQRAVPALRVAITGYPAAQLYNSLGLLLAETGEGKEALQAFQLAEKAPFHQTSAARNIGLFQTLMKPRGQD
jgi:hypothetical protein